MGGEGCTQCCEDIFTTFSSLIIFKTIIISEIHILKNGEINKHH